MKSRTSTSDAASRAQRAYSLRPATSAAEPRGWPVKTGAWAKAGREKPTLASLPTGTAADSASSASTSTVGCVPPLTGSVATGWPF